MFSTPESLKQKLDRQLGEYVKAGVVIIKDNKNEFKVTIKAPNEFRKTGKFKSSNDPRFDVSDYHYKNAKKIVKDLDFSFDGSGTHVLKKTLVHDSGVRRINISEINDENLSFHSKIFLKGLMDDNGDVDVDEMIRNLEGISQSLESEIQLFKSL